MGQTRPTIDLLLAVPEIAPREGDGRRDNRPAKAKGKVATVSLRRQRTEAKRQRQEEAR